MARSIVDCPFRQHARRDGETEIANCELLQHILGIEETALCEVGKEVCEACCGLFSPSIDCPNPVVASLLYERCETIVDRNGVIGCDAGKAAGIQEWAMPLLDYTDGDDQDADIPERADRECCFLGQRIGFRVRSAASGRLQAPVYACHHPDHLETTANECIACRDWSDNPDHYSPPVESLLPLKNENRKQQPDVRTWSVGITTAPRRRPTLEWTLDSLTRAGWTSARLFVDSTVTVPQRYAHFPITHRDEKVGAWPNFYLGLTEMILREPHADAYLMLQDDVAFYDRSNLRTYLEQYLWPEGPACVVSLYCSRQDTRTDFGWHRHGDPWFLGALAFVFSPQAAKSLLADAKVLEHRFSGPGEGLANVDSVVGEWAHRSPVPIYYPTPSLVQHVGNVSTLWATEKSQGTRKTDQFAGDVSVEIPRVDGALADFPEESFPCPNDRADDYRGRVLQGKSRMQQASVVICGLCRDVGKVLPTVAARIERLGRQFRKYQVVLYENDSVDETVAFLERWRQLNPAVHVMSETLGLPRYPQIRSLTRVTKLAYYRNRCREHAIANFGDYEFLIMLDTDLEDGWSYDGIANTFGYTDWDFVGSNGIQIDLTADDPESTQLHFDAWAYRHEGDNTPLAAAEVGPMIFRRGEPLVRVWSCFGGLGVYGMAAMKSAEYDGEDLEHASLHRKMREAGYDRMFLNPSQIVLYPRNGEPTDATESLAGE